MSCRCGTSIFSVLKGIYLVVCGGHFASYAACSVLNSPGVCDSSGWSSLRLVPVIGWTPLRAVEQTRAQPKSNVVAIPS